MNLFSKIAIVLSVPSVILAIYIHQPIPRNVPDHTVSQFMINVVSFIEICASLIEFMGLTNRWYPYRFELGARSFPEDIDSQYVDLAGVDSVVIKIKELESSSGLSPAIVFYHGGGFVSGSLNTYHDTLISIARITKFVVVAPKLAPEHPFPVPYEDCLNSTITFFERSKEFRVDSNRIILAGDSAGGNLAVSVALQLVNAIDGAKHLPALIVSIAPLLQLLNLRLPSHQQNDGLVFKKNSLSKFWLSYIGLNHRLDLSEVVSVNGHIRESAVEKTKIISTDWIPDQYKQGYSSTPIPLTPRQSSLLDDDVMEHLEKSALDVRITPLMASDEELKQLPPTYIVASEYDSLRDDGIIFYQRLKNLKKDATLHMVENSIHLSFQIGLLFPDSYCGKEYKIMFDVIKNKFSG